MDEVKRLEKEKAKATSRGQWKECGDISHCIGTALYDLGLYDESLKSHQEELEFYSMVEDHIGMTVANRKIGECYAAMKNFKKALEHINKFLDRSPRSTNSSIEEQRAFSTKETKKFAVIKFVSDDRVEVVPTTWLLGEKAVMWPTGKPDSYINKWIKMCKDPGDDWSILKIFLYTKMNSFSKANQKAQKALITSNIGSDSSEQEDDGKRKRMHPARYRKESESSDEEHFVKSKQRCVLTTAQIGETSDEDITPDLRQKKFRTPYIPQCSDSLLSPRQGIRKNSLNKNFVQNTQSASLLSPRYGIGQNYSSDLNNQSVPLLSPMQSIRNRNLDVNSKSSHSTSNDSDRIFAMMSRLFKSVESLQQDVKEIKNNQELILSHLNTGGDVIARSLFELPSDLELPISSDEILRNLEERLQADKDFRSFLIRYLNCVSSGKTPSTFLLSLTRRLMTREVALLYSRLGRKGKKSFEELPATFHTILAAASLNFKEISKQELSEKFGKILAGAQDMRKDWDKNKKVNEQPVEENFSTNLNLV